MGVGYLLRGKHYRATRKIKFAQRMLMSYFNEGHEMVLEAKHHHGMALLACGDYLGALASHLFVMRSRLQVPTNQYAPIDGGDPPGLAHTYIPSMHLFYVVDYPPPSPSIFQLALDPSLDRH